MLIDLKEKGMNFCVNNLSMLSINLKYLWYFCWKQILRFSLKFKWTNDLWLLTYFPADCMVSLPRCLFHYTALPNIFQNDTYGLFTQSNNLKWYYDIICTLEIFNENGEYYVITFSNTFWCLSAKKWLEHCSFSRKIYLSPPVTSMVHVQTGCAGKTQ